MNDTCKNCTVRGDMGACLDTPCNTRDSWYAKQLAAKNKSLRGVHDAAMTAVDFMRKSRNATKRENKALREALQQAVTSMQDSGYSNKHVAGLAARQALADRGEK